MLTAQIDLVLSCLAFVLYKGVLRIDVGRRDAIGILLALIAASVLQLRTIVPYQKVCHAFTHPAPYVFLFFQMVVEKPFLAKYTNGVKLRGQAGSTYTRIRIQRQLALPGL